MEGLRKCYSELEGKAEGYLATMRKNKEEHAQMEELLRGEIAQHVSKCKVQIVVNSCKSGPLKHGGPSTRTNWEFDSNKSFIS